MADDDEEAAEPAVELGPGAPVEGAPLARVASRFTWGIQRSEIVRRDGETTIRTPKGPRRLADILAHADVPYFESRREFVETVREQVGDGPVPAGEVAAAEDEGDADGNEATGDEADETDA
ncbi:hypothetical protein J2752_002194 [Halarchaeum rubridurum]|uniref:Uncharacterized protein n=1 Tax=Halarchaeum rubridurum TaxID=489911 RepID=A0A830G264_9EURY|nr:DUF5789 family protein [Halarchaeum rubridurum]MBP1955271.1 hypothetical protein [Halarchaeum rubridurum]GGM70860.1 hypothetical protein GCM10009017_21270 [Halarchaeum rubridurum]